MDDKICENCTRYIHTPNILGGVAECAIDVKPLNAFWTNEACDKHEATKRDNLKAQNDYYKEHLEGKIQLTKGR